MVTDLLVPGAPQTLPRRAMLQRVGISPRSLTMIVSGLATFALLLVMMLRPVPYAVQGAGPTFDTLPDGEDAELITVTGAPTYPTSGQLRLTTVTTAGGPGYPVDAGGVIRGWVDPGSAVVPVEAAIDPTVSREELDDLAAQQMISSQENATVAALTELGYEVPAVLTIVGDAPELGAHGVVREGDVLTTVETPDVSEVEITTYQVLADVLDATSGGTTISLGVERDGVATDLEVVTTDDGAGGSVLGIYLDATFDFPVDVTIAIENVGGPSAGTMFALGIIDVLTPGEMTGGNVIAGTGTITLDGQVGPIGGIAQKMFAARRDGADYFLAPASNCAAVAGNVPARLAVFSVSTLAEARTAVEAIADGETAGLPTCEG